MTLNDSFTWIDYQELDKLCDQALSFIKERRRDELDCNVDWIINDSWEAKFRRWFKLKPISKEVAEKEFIDNIYLSMSYHLMYGEVYEVATRLKRIATTKHQIQICSKDYELLTSVIN